MHIDYTTLKYYPYVMNGSEPRENTYLKRNNGTILSMLKCSHIYERDTQKNLYLKLEEWILKVSCGKGTPICCTKYHTSWSSFSSILNVIYFLVRMP